jgi:hypothetical protein
MVLARLSKNGFPVLPLTLVLAGCSGASDNGSGGPDASKDTSTHDVSASDATGQDTGATDTGNSDTATGDTGSNDSGSSDASDGGCPPSWLMPPSVDPSIAVPSDGGGVLAHGAGSGTQNYACDVTLDGGTSWTLTGPTATLDDCTGGVLAHHFASDGGAAFPEWQAPDGTYVVGHKLAAFTPDGGAASVPWLLLQAVTTGGTGTLAQVAYVQRLDTDGGVAPAGVCEAGATQDVTYTADYYFYGP